MPGSAPQELDPAPLTRREAAIRFVDDVWDGFDLGSLLILTLAVALIINAVVSSL